MNIFIIVINIKHVGKNQDEDFISYRREIVEHNCILFITIIRKQKKPDSMIRLGGSNKFINDILLKEKSQTSKIMMMKYKDLCNTLTAYLYKCGSM